MASVLPAVYGFTPFRSICFIEFDYSLTHQCTAHRGDRTFIAIVAHRLAVGWLVAPAHVNFRETWPAKQCAMQDNTKRRVDALARQLLPARETAQNSSCASNTDCEQSLATQDTSAVRQGKDSSSYARVHGEVSREPANWTNIPSVQQQKLEEVLYHKVLEEGIAKVRKGPNLPGAVAY